MREAFGIKIELPQRLGLLSVGVQIGSEKRRRLGRVFHNAVGKHLDHAGAEKIRIDIVFPALLNEQLHRLIAVVVGLITDRHAHAHVELATLIEPPPHFLLVRCHTRIH